MKKNDKPSQHFVGAILRAYDKEAETGCAVTCSGMWDHIAWECMRSGQGAFDTMFGWDTSTAAPDRERRIGTIAECIRRGYVPGLELAQDRRGWEYVRPCSS